MDNDKTLNYSLDQATKNKQTNKQNKLNKQINETKNKLNKKNYNTVLVGLSAIFGGACLDCPESLNDCVKLNTLLTGTKNKAQARNTSSLYYVPETVKLIVSIT